MKHQRRPFPAVIAHLNQLRDEALNETFPASDPVAIAVEFASAEETSFYSAVDSRSRSEPSKQTVRRANKGWVGEQCIRDRAHCQLR